MEESERRWWLRRFLRRVREGGYPEAEHDTRAIMRDLSEDRGYPAALADVLEEIWNMWGEAYWAYMERLRAALTGYEEAYRLYKLGLAGKTHLVDAAKHLALAALDTRDVERVWEVLNRVGGHGTYWAALMTKAPEGGEEVGKRLEDLAEAVRSLAREFQRISAIRVHAQEILHHANAMAGPGQERWSALLERRLSGSVAALRLALGKDVTLHPRLREELRVLLPAMAAFHGSKAAAEIAKEEIRTARGEFTRERAKFYLGEK